MGAHYKWQNTVHFLYNQMQLFLIIVTGQFQISPVKYYMKTAFSCWSSHECPLNASVHLLPELFRNEMNVVKCGLFYFRRLRSLTLLQTPLSFYMCLHVHVFSLTIASCHSF